MENLRKYGPAPFTAAVIHGGPGAAGEMAPVAKELSQICGILEPLQTATSVDGQVQELQAVLEEHATLPVTLIGYSWGAWLGLIHAARHPAAIKKLVLVSSGALEEKYAVGLIDRRLNRLTPSEKSEAQELIQALNRSNCGDDQLERFGALMSQADTFNPLPEPEEKCPVKINADIFRGVWSEASELRSSGQLLDLARRVRCPVLALHGDYDPTLAEGVEQPLARSLKEFRFIRLKNCGHTPWKERQAQTQFYGLLAEVLRQA